MNFKKIKEELIKLLGGYTLKELINGQKIWRDEYDESLLEINGLNEEIRKLKTERLAIKKGAKETLEVINNLEQQISKLKKNEPLPKQTKELIDFYDNKYPSKDIKYGGVIIKTKKFGNIKPRISVCDFVTTTETMRKWIIDKNLMFKGTKSVTNFSKHMWKIYSEFTKNTKYVTDAKLYGENERWQPNMLQPYIKDGSKWTGDCENMTLLCMGLFEAAGIPRGLYRNVCGTTKLGGHSCLFAFDWRTKNWQQWETTSTRPRVIAANERIYIYKVWFSFDNEKAWSTKPKLTYSKLKE